MATREQSTMSRHGLSCIPWESVNEPGIYANPNTGLVFRITERAVERGSSPVLHVYGSSEFQVVKLSDDTNLTRSKVHQLCLEHNIQPSFTEE